VVVTLVALTVAVIGLCIAGFVLLEARLRAAALPHAFRCKVAVAKKGRPVLYRWPRRVSYAVWVHDVLIVFDGFSRTRVRPFAVHFAEGPVATMVRPVHGLDISPVVMSIETDDGRHALLAAPRSSAELVAGPFVAALMGSDEVAASRDRSGD
jgi:hypothetical protein